MTYVPAGDGPAPDIPPEGGKTAVVQPAKTKLEETNSANRTILVIRFMLNPLPKAYLMPERNWTSLSLIFSSAFLSLYIPTGSIPIVFVNIRYFHSLELI